MSWFPKKRVVVPVDFSGDSLEAIDVGLTLVKDPSEVHVVHVLPQMSVMEPGNLYGDVTEETRRKHVVEAIRKKLCCSPEREKLTIAVLVGVSHREICEYAGDVDADLIVLSSHGRTGAAQFLLGSTAERVVHYAKCPVLVLKK
jgi:nucleotide-binding universal stress UspA family protein